MSKLYRSPGDEVWAVREASVRIPPGTFVCVYGASGSGKSTLLSLVAGLEDPTSGAVLVAGRDVAAMTEAQRANMRLRRVGVVFQDDNLLEEFTALENVMLPLEVQGASHRDAQAQATFQLTGVGMPKLGHRLPAELSGGQRQRVGIARSLVGERVLLLADEPTGSLDSANSGALFELLRTLCDDGITLLLASHEPSARAYADVIIEMVDGRLHSTSSPQP